jgi:uncharacterized membrane protein YqjE
MDDGSPMPLTDAAKRFARRLLAIGENRFQLLVVEVQEERDRLLGMVFLGIATGAFGMLVGILWSAALVIFFWDYGPVRVLLILGAVYAVAAFVLCKWLFALRDHQQTFAATREQFRKDRECLKRN